MCVICHKPQGVELPSDATIRKMFASNPHGAGFAIQGNIGRKGKFGIEFHKGYMTVEEFLKAIHSYKNLKDKRVVMHFRIKTSGETDQATTHPHKMSYNFNDLRQLHGHGSVLFHNGIFSGLGGLVDKRASDTQDFVIGIAMRYLRKACIPNKLDLQLASSVIGSCRVIILYPNPKYQFNQFGNWTKHTDGCEYSNMNWNYVQTSTEYHYSSHYHSTQSSTKSSYRDIDAFGCNVAPWATPGVDCDWVNARTPERLEQLLKRAQTVSEEPDEQGWYHLKYISTGDKQWFASKETLDILSEDALGKLTDKYTELSKLSQFGAEEEDEVIEFQDDYDLIDFVSMGHETGPYEIRMGGKTWYIDTVMLVAYTEQGIRNNFKTGDIGHVIRQLKESGTYDTQIRNKYEHIEDGFIEDRETRMIEAEIDRFYGQGNA